MSRLVSRFFDRTNSFIQHFKYTNGLVTNPLMQRTKLLLIALR